jgi:GH18 family chitinase
MKIHHTRSKLLALGLALAVSCTNAFAAFKVVGYFPSWQGSVSAIQYSKVTHINYAFVLPNSNGTLQAVDNAAKLQSLVSTAHSNGVKVGISVGGWNNGDTTAFESLAANSTYRTNFVNNLVNFVTQYGLDGVDIDWEYPNAGSSANNYATMMSQLATAMHSRGKYLTAAVVAYGSAGDAILSGVFTSVDWLNLMDYDNTNGVGQSTYQSAITCLDYWVSNRGLPASKAVLGVPFYSDPSDYAFYQLLSMGADPFADSWGSEGYNGLTTIKSKTNLCFDRGIGGIMMWELSQDATGTNSLLSAIDSVVDQRQTAAVAAPSFSPGGGSYTAAQSVTITTATSGASIRYTLDGSTPTSTSGTLYSGPVTIASTATLKAIAYASGLTNSPITSATYTIGAASGATITSANGFVNQALATTQTGTFTASFDARPSLSPANDVAGLSSGVATAYTGIAAMVRFNTTGTIDARNGGAFTTGTIPFSANTTYHFRLVVNVPAHTYSAYVTAPGGAEQTIGTNLAFRTEQAAVTSLSQATFNVNATPGGSLTYWPVTLSTSPVAAKLSIPGTAVTASADDGNVPANTVDGNLATRWSASGDGQWILYDLGASKTVTQLKIAFYSGDVRTSTFDVQVGTSPTGTFTTINSYTSSGTSTALQTFNVTDTSTRYVRLLGHGNSVNLWNSYSETEIWGY